MRVREISSEPTSSAKHSSRGESIRSAELKASREAENGTHRPDSGCANLSAKSRCSRRGPARRARRLRAHRRGRAPRRSSAGRRRWSWCGCTEPKFVPQGARAGWPRPGVSRRRAPELPIARGLAGPGLLADTIVRRWQDHLPLHRLERIYGREGLELARSTDLRLARRAGGAGASAHRGDVAGRAGLALPVHRRHRRLGAGPGEVPRRPLLGASPRPRSTCSSTYTRQARQRRRRRACSPATRATSSPTPTPSTTTSTQAARSWRSAAGRTRGGTSSRRSRPTASVPRAGAGAHRRALPARARARDAAAAQARRRRAAGVGQADRRCASSPGARWRPARALDETPIQKALRYALNQRAALSALPRRRSAAHPQQLQRARAAPRGRRPQELALRRHRVRIPSIATGPSDASRPLVLAHADRSEATLARPQALAATSPPCVFLPPRRSL